MIKIDKDFLLNNNEYTYEEKCSMAIKYIANLEDFPCLLQCVYEDTKDEIYKPFTDNSIRLCKERNKYNNCETRFVYEWLMENLKK